MQGAAGASWVRVAWPRPKSRVAGRRRTQLVGDAGLREGSCLRLTQDHEVLGRAVLQGPLGNDPVPGAESWLFS